jgi:L-rhamnose-H+ transport protein
VQGCFAWIIAPAILATVLVPGCVAILRGASPSTLLYAFFWGAMWGVGGLLFGLGVRYLGIALGYTVALGFSTAFGTLMPPLFSGQLRVIAAERSGRVTLAGVGVCLLAIVISGWAGRCKEVELAGKDAEEAASPGGHGEFRFGRGLLVAMFAGIFSACFAYGLAAAKPISESARVSLIAHGHSDLWQSLPALVIVLWGGWATNAAWCGGLLIRNRSARQFGAVPEHGGKQLLLNYMFAAMAGLLWYGQFFFYSMGQTRMGPYDFASWALHMAGTILFATLWGAVLHEWRGTSVRTRAIGAAGLAMLLVSTVIVGWGSYLKTR